MTGSPELPSAGELVRSYGARAKRALGQHFLTDPSILERIAAASGADEGDVVLEIGPGPGGLTRTLLDRGCQVVAVELDDHAVSHLREALPSEQLTVVQGDALDLDLAALITQHEPQPRIATGNLPYNVATEVFFRLDQLDTIDRMALMFQREVGKRFVAEPGTKVYGPLALMGAIRWRADIAMKLPPGAFVPRPKVHSVVVRFERLAAPAVDPELEPRFRTLVRGAFQKRRKTLRNALSGLLDASEIEAAGVDPGLRPERLALSDYVALARR